MNYSNKTILITGGTGSFGNKVANFLFRQSPKKIIVFSRDEKKQYEMQKIHPDYEYIIGDIRDASRVRYAMRNVDYVFHASALKQVPSCEVYPIEAVKTNILGSQNLCESAIECGVEVVVALSTDKAVKPINAMGISKAMMEKIVCSQNMTSVDTRFCCVRYGNVMGSRGSVIPLFLKQIKEGKRLTITDPNMTRFLMTLDQSVELVSHAINSVKGGEIFVKKAPACTVIDLARTMIKKYGDGDEGRINIVGVRPGEKIDEVLVSEYEIQRAEENDSFFHIRPEYLNGKMTSKYEAGYEYTSANTKRLTKYEDISYLLDMMGETEFFT
jgi:UDP-N-acetylglucosamine 4,6-dehydratase/5-epimerase